MKTPWTDLVDRSAPLPEYPRPQMVRQGWMNLNGLWDYAITDSSRFPRAFDGEILVPFSPETELSGVGRALKGGQYLWYRRTVTLPTSFSGRRILLHFGAADQIAAVWVNDALAMQHAGGYLPFEADVTDFIVGGAMTITVRISDETERSELPRGKQRTRHGGIWYTPQSGIWQTVWLEAVPTSYVKALRITPDLDGACVRVAAETVGGETACAVFGGEEYRLPAAIPVPGYEAWSPEHPKLYPFSVRCGEDLVQSYFAMRSFSVEADERGVQRLFLNGKPYFHNGLLDQGYWPDGLYTAPCDEAMIYDISTAKSMGYNMLRKHMKIEPLRWYYHCDRLGMLVWQDMPSGGGHYNPAVITAPLVTGLHLPDRIYPLFARTNRGAREEFRSELRELVRHLYNCPCIAVWVPFNEGWGQFDAAAVYEELRELDPSRTIDHASGWHDQGVGPVRSEHVYFRKYAFRPDKKGRAVLLSEFGGYNLRVDGHCWGQRDFGYKRFDGPEDLREALAALYRDEIAPAAREGLAAAVYTQLSDVEDELNGLLTYDRKVVKINPDIVKNISKVEI